MAKLVIAVELQPDGGFLAGTVEPSEVLRTPLRTPVVDEGHTYTAVEIIVDAVPEQGPTTVAAPT